MTKANAPRRSRRGRLGRERILQAALHLADQGGVAALSMRKIAGSLGVEAMSLYHHVANKGEILDGVVGLVFAEIGPLQEEDWKAAVERWGCSVRRALRERPWVVGLLNRRGGAGAAQFRHHDAMLDHLGAAGFPADLAARAVSVVDAYVYGFVLREQSLTPGTDQDEQFGWGLELVIDGIEVRRFLARHLSA